jgi:CIC family chloride channel protein
MPDIENTKVSDRWRLLRRWGNRLTAHVDRTQIPESGVIILTALLVGIGAGLGAVIFRRLIQGIQSLTYGTIASWLESIGQYLLVIIPAIGGLFVGWLIYNFAREAKGHGVPEVMEAIALRGGRIRPRVVIVKALASSISIGTGGSVGREGPIVQIGSAIGSTIGQLLKLSDERVKNLVACGAAGGIAATFNAPIGGSLFALEVILGQFHTTYFGAVVISAVTADVVARIFEGDLRAFLVPEYALVSPWELLLYAVLGLLAAVGAVFFTRSLYASEDIWNRLPMPEYIKPALGGALLGVLGLATYKLGEFPRIFGVGYETISDALSNNLVLQVTAALVLLKLLATVITLGSGASGGVFAPSLFMGSMLGSSFGQVVNQLFPSITAPAGAYALVGMAAFFSGAAHAPVTAILILFEMTGDYRIILPLMLATVISTLVARLLDRESIYTLKLTRRGVHLEYGQDIDVMQGVQVGEIMTTEVDAVAPEDSLTSLAKAFARTHHHGFPVLDSQGDLEGMVTIQDFERAMESTGLDDRSVADIMTSENLLVSYPHEPVWEALKRLSVRDVGRLPVLEYDGSRKLVGMIRRSDIVRAYQVAIVNRSHHQYKAEVLKLKNLTNATFLHLTLPENAAVIGRRVREIELPVDCLIVSVLRGQKQHVVHGNTILQANDQITVFADESCSSHVREQLLELQVEGEVDQNQKNRNGGAAI